jgi:hypothetical protein
VRAPTHEVTGTFRHTLATDSKGNTTTTSFDTNNQPYEVIGKNNGSTIQ